MALSNYISTALMVATLHSHTKIVACAHSLSVNTQVADLVANAGPLRPSFIPPFLPFNLTLQNGLA